MVQLVSAGAGDRETVARLLQLYLHELSGIAPERIRIGDDGAFAYPYFDTYFSDADSSDAERRAYLIRSAGRLAGFALVRLTEPREIAEFFVLRGERGAGTGRAAARAAFARHPGSWVVRQLPGNVAATAFWRAAIPVAFDESVLENGRVEQRFTV